MDDFFKLFFVVIFWLPHKPPENLKPLMIDIVI